MYLKFFSSAVHGQQVNDDWLSRGGVAGTETPSHPHLFAPFFWQRNKKPLCLCSFTHLQHNKPEHTHTLHLCTHYGSLCLFVYFLMNELWTKITLQFLKSVLKGWLFIRKKALNKIFKSVNKCVGVCDFFLKNRWLILCLTSHFNTLLSEWCLSSSVCGRNYGFVLNHRERQTLKPQCWINEELQLDFTPGTLSS